MRMKVISRLPAPSRYRCCDIDDVGAVVEANAFDLCFRVIKRGGAYEK